MAENAAPERTILKILNGLQAGAEVSLVPGDYSLGSGAEDDIQLVDVSLKPAHLKLRVAAGKIQIAGGAGAFRTARGLIVAAGNQDWQEIEPLDVITAGTTRFALGAPTAQWATITDDDSAQAGDPLQAAARRAAAQGRGTGDPSGGRGMIPWLLVGALVIGGGIYAYQVYGPRQAAGVVDTRSEVEILREALDQMPFGRAIEIRREVDGTIFASGFVESPVERRALVNAAERSGVPAHLRVWVLQSVRNELDNLIKARRLPLTASVSPQGDVVLDGVVLDTDTADRFVALVKDSVLGIKSIDSRIKTARTLLRDVERLARQSQIEPLVLFRLERDLIEVSGAIPVGRIDSWLGFLQAYSARYAKDIALRSLVQLQTESGEKIAARPVVIGGRAGEGEVQLDPEKLRVGDYDVNELFGGPRRGAPAAAVAPAGTPPRPGAAAGGPPRPGPEARNGAPGNAPAGPGVLPAAVVGLSGGQSLGITAEQLLERHRKSEVAPDTAGAPGTKVQAAVDNLARAGWDGPAGSDRISALYLPLFRNQSRLSDKPCWPGSSLSTASLPGTLFWLDLLSVSNEMTLVQLDVGQQRLLLEAALNPRRTAACAALVPKFGTADSVASASLYLSEAKRNPDFIRFVARDVPLFGLDVSGAALGDDRYVQTREGGKILEGGAPDGATRLVVVAELGALIQTATGHAVVLFEPGINWVSNRF